MTTAAKPTTNNGAHWYDKDGNPCHFVEKKSGGLRPSTIADARKFNWLPSVTTILKVLDKPALTNWLVEQAVLAVITTPRLPGEADDAFIQRVLHTERQQDQESQKARDLGTDIHDAIEKALAGEIVPEGMGAFVNPVLAECAKFGKAQDTELIVVGEGYAGKLDATFISNGTLTIVDFKTTSKPPKQEKGSWNEHRLQLAAYAKATQQQTIQTANIYISTKDPGVVVPIINPPWQDDYPVFESLLKVWQWMNSYPEKTI